MLTANNRLANVVNTVSIGLLLPPDYPLYNADGSYNWYITNPLAESQAQSISKTDNLLGNLSLKYTALKGLDLKINSGFTKINSDQTQIFPSASLYPGSVNYTNFGHNSNQSVIIEPQISYNRTFSKSKLSLLVGGTYQNTNSKEQLIIASAFTNAGLMQDAGSAGSVIVNTGSTQDYIDFEQDKVATANTANLNTWKTFYLIIYQCNDIISQLAKSNLPGSTVTRLNCEARFLRAYAYYYLINLYGHVPLILTTDVNTNKAASQSEAAAVNQQIVADLQEAIKGLPISYTGSGKVRANKWAAAALLAKAYLFLGDWKNADLQSSAVINSGLYTPLTAAGTVFEANSGETILSKLYVHLNNATVAAMNI